MPTPGRERARNVALAALYLGTALLLAAALGLARQEQIDAQRPRPTPTVVCLGAYCQPLTTYR